ncbi:MAG TPA: S-methyl-5-thioribose-1-phosphate isomerase [Smithella sp.]|nr:S-methyl-5-thioribose-1-phosphate isomerase [Smithella sp.]MDM7986717.1 S-methyl-5-thioribose-1-phosphate isomerase [Smithella sp.]HNY51393.1 S-methyl-5-thioribose-1-phosphate isomerase [Smithella sp.]HOG91318.1 S-methyl-5-thioribose-1-phosphate isomerase [Smithella sp.]HOU51474.1 S-methyl-5-thioribose-1-phosphate isomerase [Smithella sp.]
MIKTIFWKNNTAVLIDQNALPLTEKYVTCKSYKQVISCIKDLTLRGAPAIGVAAAMGAALGALHLPSTSPEKFRDNFFAICDEIAQARPTARNLFWALERMKNIVDRRNDVNQKHLIKELIYEAKRICSEDIEINRKMGKNGCSLIADDDNILTHCNAGALATAGYGTALGVIRAAKEQGKKLHVYVDETRPVLQGARLTAWELKKEKIPHTLITDNMAGFLMSQKKIDKIIVGADRIATNGDTANKIGTYTLAVLAKAHRIPFYIAAPVSTIDFSLKTGAGIPIEERKSDEVTHFKGVRSAPAETKVYNPAFDVTPARFITAIITEKEILRKPFRDSIARLHKGVRIG